MRRLWFALLSVLAVASITAVAAFGASVHFKGGATGGPFFNDGGLTLASSGAFSGLGNGDIVVELVAKGNPSATCTNPGSGVHQPPGQNPAEVTLTGTQGIPAGSIINGNVPFGVETQAPVTPILGAPGCPNVQWVEDITDVAFTSGTINVYQPSVLAADGSVVSKGPQVFTATCTFNPATSDGAVPARTVSCPRK